MSTQGQALRRNTLRHRARRVPQEPRRRIDLRTRMSFAIGLLFTAALAVAALVAVGNARVAVSGEMDTSLRSAGASLDLVLWLARDRDEAGAERALRDWVAGFDGARHLCVSLESNLAPGDPCAFAPGPAGVPGWFARGAEFSGPALMRELRLDSQTLRVRVRADPRDELREAWIDVRSLLLVMAALAFAVNLCVFLTISYALRPLDQLVRAMDQIGRGKPATELPRSGSPEIQMLARGLGELAERIAHGREQVRALHLRNLDLQEEERRMVARELHDEIGQHVTAIEMESIRIARMAPAEQAQRRVRLQQLRASIAEIHRVSRRLVGRLRPPSIESLGLVGALDALLERWREDHPDSELGARIDPACEDVSNERAVHLYRLVQEGLSNAARHAQARRVWVEVGREGGRLRLRIADDGRGFDLAGPVRGHGLAGMRERVEALAGSFELRSAPGAGTRVDASFPPG